MNKSYFDAFGATIAADKIASKAGLSYLSAASAMALAGRPAVDFVEFDGKPHLECLGGALVAVDVELPGSGIKQRMWLPVMDQDNNTISLEQMTINDVNNSRQRCLVKAIAAAHGDGMSLYLGCDGAGDQAVKMLGVTPDTDLAVVEPLVATLKEGGAAYIEWGVAVAACRITDPDFIWSVVDWNGVPYREVLMGLMVDVDTVYRGKRQRLSLPIMDSAFNPIPVGKASTFDWNKTVMRALTKCIAFNTGYGLAVYGEEYGANTSKGPSAPKAARVKKDKAPAAAPADPVVETPAASEQPVVVQPAIGTPTETQADAVAKFKAIMQKRRATDGIPGLIGLFKALAESTKFADADKPGCFSMLVPAVASVVTPAEVSSLLAEVTTYNAMQYVAADGRDLVAGKLVTVALAMGCAAGDAVLAQTAQDLVTAGIATDMADVLRLAAAGKTPKETLDLLMALLDAVAA